MPAKNDEEAQMFKKRNESFPEVKCTPRRVGHSLPEMKLMERTNSKPEAYKRKGSTKSTTSVKNEGVYVKRMSSTPSTSQPFERQLSSVASGKSLASIRTRLTSITRSDYHTDLKPQIESGLNINLVFTSFIIVFGCSFLFGYNIGVLNQPEPLIMDFYNRTYQERYGEISEGTLQFLYSLTNALFIPGGMIGAFLGGSLADRLGRKRAILLSHVFAFLGAAVSCACLASKAPEMLMLGRVLVGINSGLGNCIAPIFLSEISPCNLRGAFGTLHQLFVTLGIFLSSVFGLRELLGTETRWPYLILLEAIPAATSLIILPFLPETPRYLLLKQGERSQATEALKFYRRTDDVSADMEEMDTEQQAEKDSSKTTFTLKMLLTAKDLWRPLFIACALQIVQQFSGINAVFFYSSGIFKQAGVEDDKIQYCVVGTNAVNVVMTIVSVAVMDLAGRRLLLLIPMGFMIIDLVLLTIALNLQNTVSGMAYLSISCIIIYVICFAVGLGPIPMMIGAELFRQTPRPVAMAIAGVFNWTGTFVIAISFKSVADGAGNYTFLIFLVLMILFTVFVYFFVPETKNRTFEEIAHQFSPGGDIEVEEMVDEVFDDDMQLPNEDGENEDHQLVTLNFDKRKNDSTEGINSKTQSPGEKPKEK